MLYSCCTKMEDYSLLEKAGYDGIILAAAEVAAMDEGAFLKAADRIQKGPLCCNALNSFCPPELKLCGPGYDKDAVAAYIGPLARRAAKLSVRQIGIGSPKSRSIPQGYSRETATGQLRQSFEVICKACACFGIDVLAEAVCDLECNFITTTDEAAALIETIDAENIGLVFDTYHAFMMGEDDKPLRRAIRRIRLIHTAQDIEGKRHYLRKENMDEYRVFFDALLEEGYDGEVAIEAFYDEIGQQLGTTLAIMKSLCETAAV